MTVPSLHVLHFEDDPDDALRILDFLEGEASPVAKVTTVELLADGLRRMRATPFDVLILKLDLPDSAGLPTLERLRAEAPDLPIIVLTDGEDPGDAEATCLLRIGAQECLPKPSLTAPALQRSVRLAIERHRCALELHRRATQLQEAEHRIRKVIEASADAMVIVDANGIIQYANPAAGSIFGRDADSMIAQPFGFPLTTDQTTELEIPDADGTHRIAEMRVVETRWCDRVAYLAALRDITERRRMEAQLVRAQRMDSLGALAGGIAHDLNNVLAPIIMSIEVLHQKVPSSEGQAFLRIIDENARRGAEMVRQILTFACGTDGQREIINPRDFVADIARILNDTLLKSVQLNTCVAPDTWSIEGHLTQLHQVFINLGVNARDAMPPGGLLSLSVANARLDDRCRQISPEASPGPYVVFTVSDTGTGIRPEILHRIFDPFFTTKKLGQGSGLGLAAVRGIVKSHGGFINVDSKREFGTTFRIYLPACAPEEKSAESRPIDRLPRGNGELVLIVDDETPIRQMTQYTLDGYGYRTLLASDGREALALYAQHQAEISVVLTDMMMPHLDGAATIRSLRLLNPSVRIIAASGLATESQSKTAASAGGDLFLPKPFTAQALLNTLHQVLQPRPRDAVKSAP